MLWLKTNLPSLCCLLEALAGPWPPSNHSLLFEAASSHLRHAVHPYFFHLCVVQAPVNTAAPFFLLGYMDFSGVQVYEMHDLSAVKTVRKFSINFHVKCFRKVEKSPSTLHPVHCFLLVVPPHFHPQLPLCLFFLFINPFSHPRYIIFHIDLHLFIFIGSQNSLGWKPP